VRPKLVIQWASPMLWITLRCPLSSHIHCNGIVVVASDQITNADGDLPTKLKWEADSSEAMQRHWQIYWVDILQFICVQPECGRLSHPNTQTSLLGPCRDMD